MSLTDGIEDLMNSITVKSLQQGFPDMFNILNDGGIAPTFFLVKYIDEVEQG